MNTFSRLIHFPNEILDYSYRYIIHSDFIIADQELFMQLLVSIANGAIHDKVLLQNYTEVSYHDEKGGHILTEHEVAIKGEELLQNLRRYEKENFFPVAERFSLKQGNQNNWFVYVNSSIELMLLCTKKPLDAKTLSNTEKWIISNLSEHYEFLKGIRVRDSILSMLQKDMNIFNKNNLAWEE
ncbi:hypothetical protein [Owenweeksia hongkongensis]|uniref:hypothetical protein n=1 Tax=Owenweeksia hongkongensis TaxID=253245 RepID=UPI003A8FFDA5